MPTQLSSLARLRGPEAATRPSRPHKASLTSPPALLLLSLPGIGHSSHSDWTPALCQACAGPWPKLPGS